MLFDCIWMKWFFLCSISKKILIFRRHSDECCGYRWSSNSQINRIKCHFAIPTICVSHGADNPCEFGWLAGYHPSLLERVSVCVCLSAAKPIAEDQANYRMHRKDADDETEIEKSFDSSRIEVSKVIDEYSHLGFGIMFQAIFMFTVW